MQLQAFSTVRLDCNEWTTSISSQISCRENLTLLLENTRLARSQTQFGRSGEKTHNSLVQYEANNWATTVQFLGNRARPAHKPDHLNYIVAICAVRPCRPIGLWGVEAHTLSRQSALRWWSGCQPHARAALYSPATFLFVSDTDFC
jgi:hypothetical protein